MALELRWVAWGFGIGHIRGALPWWKYEFLIISALCCCWGIIMFITPPDDPVTEPLRKSTRASNRCGTAVREPDRIQEQTFQDVPAERMSGGLESLPVFRTWSC